jgi:hypothetical protein
VDTAALYRIRLDGAKDGRIGVHKTLAVGDFAY